MTNYLKTFFYPPVLTHSYNLPKELVIAVIAEVFTTNLTLFNGNDMKGRFLNSDTFTIDTASPAFTNAVKYGATLVGKISESQKGITLINTKAKPANALYFLFFITIIVGVVYFYQYTQTASAAFLYWSLAMLIIGPALSIGLSTIAIAVIRERFNMYIDKKLKG